MITVKRASMHSLTARRKSLEVYPTGSIRLDEAVVIDKLPLTAEDVSATPTFDTVLFEVTQGDTGTWEFPVGSPELQQHSAFSINGGSVYDPLTGWFYYFASDGGVHRKKFATPAEDEVFSSQVLSNGLDGFQELALSPDGSKLVRIFTGDEVTHGGFLAWDTATGALLGEANQWDSSHNRGPYHVACSNDKVFLTAHTQFVCDKSSVRVFGYDGVYQSIIVWSEDCGNQSSEGFYGPLAIINDTLYVEMSSRVYAVDVTGPLFILGSDAPNPTPFFDTTPFNSVSPATHMVLTPDFSEIYICYGSGSFPNAAGHGALIKVNVATGVGTQLLFDQTGGAVEAPGDIGWVILANV